jgi:tight adherence protein B
MDSVFLTFVIIAFVAVVLLIEGAYLLWNSYRGAEAQRVQQRLAALSAAGHAADGYQLLKQRFLGKSAAAERMLLHLPRVHQLDRMLLQSGLLLSVGGFVNLMLGCTSAGALAWMLLPTPAVSLPVFIAAGAAAPIAYMLRKRRHRLRTIEQQLPDALDLIARALRAGHAFASAMQIVGSESSEPLASEFRIAFDEVNYGVPIQDALTNLAKRVPLTDLRFFVIAVGIQRETGGNLSELLGTLAAMMRARFKLLGTIRVLSAEGRLSAWILTFLPFVLLAAIYAINPKFMSVLWTDPAGLKAVYFGITFMIVGMFWMWRIIKIRI